MAFHEPPIITPEQRRQARRARYAYIAIFVLSTVAVTVTLSLLGYINLNPLAALLAGTIAGFALVLFHLTYLRFIVHSAYRIEQPKDALE